MQCEGILAALVDAVASITGQDARDVHTELDQHSLGKSAADDDVRAFVARVKTRLGIAPAVGRDEAEHLSWAMSDRADIGDVTETQLVLLDRLLRDAPERVPTVARTPIQMPVLPEHQARMWSTLLHLESAAQGGHWVLVGGQMVLLHCVEAGFDQPRTTEDADIVVGVWTRRDSLRETTAHLTRLGFAEDQTSDGFGYRYRLDKAVVIDVMIPEGLERQRRFPRTSTGRKGFGAAGGNQALARAERVPLVVGGESGWVRRPTLLGAVVAKANAFLHDSRDRDRHAADLVVLTEIALRDPRQLLADTGPHDRRVVRQFLRDRGPEHAYFRLAEDPQGAHALLSRLASPE